MCPDTNWGHRSFPMRLMSAEKADKKAWACMGVSNRLVPPNSHAHAHAHAQSHFAGAHAILQGKKSKSQNHGNSETTGCLGEVIEAHFGSTVNCPWNLLSPVFGLRGTMRCSWLLKNGSSLHRVRGKIGQVEATQGKCGSKSLVRDTTIQNCFAHAQAGYFLR
jgi:hypothetical protein